MRRRIMAANWKMYKNVPETHSFFQAFLPLVHSFTAQCDIVIFPNTLCIAAAVADTKGSGVAVGGQNIHFAREGAYTGEVSGAMVRDAGATWVLVGHSERRHCFHETDAEVLKKTQAALEAGLQPIVCVGERLEEHVAGKTDEVLVRQFAAGMAGLTEEQFAKVAVAYEPVWAIGTGKTATPAIASGAHQRIRSEAQKRFGTDAASQMRILYGGSVKPDNIQGLMSEDQLDGVLVGGASLDPVSFSKIVQAG